MPIHRIATSLIVAGALCASVPAYAQKHEDPAAARMQQMLRQMSSERDVLKAENEKLQSQIKSLEAKTSAAQTQLKGADKERASSQALLQRYQDAEQAWKANSEQQKAKLQEVVDKYKELVKSLRQVEAERGELQSNSKVRDRDLDRCIEKNGKMYSTGLEVLQRYENKGVWDSIWQKEPITQLKRVELESIMEEYKGKLDDAKIKAKVSDASASP